MSVTINSSLINLGKNKILLPNTVIAEISQIDAKTDLKIENNNYSIMWRGKEIKIYTEKNIFNYNEESIFNNLINQKLYVAIINTVAPNSKIDFEGIVFLSIPSLVRVTQEDCLDIDEPTALGFPLKIKYKNQDCYLLDISQLF